MLLVERPRIAQTSTTRWSFL